MLIRNIYENLGRFSFSHVAEATDAEYAEAVACAAELIVQQAERIADMEHLLLALSIQLKPIAASTAVNAKLLRCIYDNLPEVTG
ncbi:MAG: hypothetical protein IJA75_03210 [Oscillospiraceae bacterium]|nr:hypothetical protein [Oscillospiraceae bacterium]